MRTKHRRDDKGGKRERGGTNIRTSKPRTLSGDAVISFPLLLKESERDRERKRGRKEKEGLRDVGARTSSHFASAGLTQAAKFS